MGYVRESEARYLRQKAIRQRSLEAAYAQLELEAQRTKRGDEALAKLADLVAAVFCAETTIEPTEQSERANETLRMEDRLNGNRNKCQWGRASTE